MGIRLKIDLGSLISAFVLRIKLFNVPTMQVKIFEINYADFQLTRVPRVYPQKYRFFVNLEFIKNDSSTKQKLENGSFCHKCVGGTLILSPDSSRLLQRALFDAKSYWRRSGAVVSPLIPMVVGYHSC